MGMEKIKIAKLARFLSDNDIDPFEAHRLLEGICKQVVLSRIQDAQPIKKSNGIEFNPGR